MKNGFACENDTRLKKQPRAGHFFGRMVGQKQLGRLKSSSKLFPFMLLLPRLVWVCLCLGLFISLSNAFAQTNYYSADGTEYSVVGSLPGDQVYPDVALNSSGGFVVWQDNATDGSGWGISATHLDSTFSADPVWADQRVNVSGDKDQENAHVALLKNGGAVFVWQGGQEGIDQHIYARFLTASNTWLTDDILVNTLVTNTLYAYTTNFTTTITTNWTRYWRYGSWKKKITGYTTNITTTVTANKTLSVSGLQIDPAVTVLANGDVVVTWSSFNQASATSMQDVCAQILSPTGSKIGDNFLVNQFTSFNQRNSAVAPLNDGGFVVAWVSEQQRSAINESMIDQIKGTTNTLIVLPSVDVYARLYNSNGVANANEFLVSTDSFPHANPAIAVGSDGSFVIAWSGKDTVNTDNSWDIYARSFSSEGVGGSTVVVNSHTFGDQYVPKISAIGTDCLIAWTALGEDGSREGVYGRFMHIGGSLIGDEFRINTTTASQQMQPAVASDGSSQFLAVWTSFTGNAYSFDLFAQRFVDGNAVLQPMSAPFVSAPFVFSNNVYQPQLQVSWPSVGGISVSKYEVYLDGAPSPFETVSGNSWTMTAADGLVPGSTHSFALDYVTTDGRRSPISPTASHSTWNGCSYYGIPCEWMSQYYGSSWPTSVNSPLAPGGPTLYQAFQTGANPTNSNTWLVVTLSKTSQGMFVNYNTQPGLTYQLQATPDLTTWTNVGSPWFAPGASNSVPVGFGGNSYYRVILVR